MEGGREAWGMLWRLRLKAYEKAGVKIPESVGPQIPPDAPLYITETEIETVEVVAKIVAEVTAERERERGGDREMEMEPETEPEFRRLLQMDTIIDAEDKAFFTEEFTAQFLQPELVSETPLEGARGKEGAGGEEGGDDLMDFDWEEWDQVFGKSVSVDGGFGG